MVLYAKGETSKKHSARSSTSKSGDAESQRHRDAAAILHREHALEDDVLTMRYTNSKANTLHFRRCCEKAPFGPLKQFTWIGTL
jgi:hypothetical protein